MRAQPNPWKEEQTLLTQQLETQTQVAERLATELEHMGSELAEERKQSEQIEGLYQQSQQELADAKECLLAAEKALLDQASLQ